MSLCWPAIEGQGGIENVREQDPCGGHDIRGAGAEALHPALPSTPKRLWLSATTVLPEVTSLKISRPVGAVLPATSVRASVRMLMSRSKERL